MGIAGYFSVTVSQRYVHPTPEGMERAFQRLENLNAFKHAEAEAEAASEAAGNLRAATISATARNGLLPKSSQVIDFKRQGP